MADTKFYFDFNFPMPLVELILGLIKKNKSSTAPVQTETGVREWLSQTRTSADKTTEVVTINFRIPLSVSEISMEILKMPCRMQAWYQDRSNNWHQIKDRQLNPIQARVSRSDTKSWYRYDSRCYPIVAKAVQIRMTREDDPELIDVPFPVGLKNCLIRRNVYDRAEGNPGFESYVDVMGNIIARHIKDWDATKATDDNFTTFWKSAPQPDPTAVVSLYLDVRSATGEPKVIDKVYIDPVYAGSHLNLYYSSDDTVGTRTLSQIGIPSTDTLNMEWRPSEGLYDLLSGSGQSYYQFPLKIGPQRSQDAWVGFQWKPSFASASANLEGNPTFFGVNSDPDGQFRPTVYYDSGARKFCLQFFDGSQVKVYRTEALVTEWQEREPVRVVAGWSYGPDRVWIKAVAQNGQVIAERDESGEEPLDLPAEVSVDGVVEVRNLRGALESLIVKTESFTASAESYLSDPIVYTDPDPVIQDESGRVPSTSLDNAVYAAAFTTQEHGRGGSDESHFQSKLWTPIWKDYVAVKGFLYLPRPTSMKYLKLELTNLTEEPYPIYESGIESKYKTFPISVIQQSSIGPRLFTGEGGFLGLGTFISVNGVRSVNWLNPMSVMQAIGAVIGPQTPPVVINTGIPYVTETMPRQGDALVEESRRIEAASSYVFSRDSLQPYMIAKDQHNTIIKAEGLQAIQPYVDVPWQEIQDANPGAVTKVRATGTVPIRGTDWWIYPGQQLKIPAAVMTKLTDTQTVTERKLTLESRVRFNTTSVHHYTYRTLKRDAAIAYFAALREVQPYTSTYLPGEDKPIFDFPSYDPDQWVLDPQVVRAKDADTDEDFGPIGVSLAGPGTAFKSLTTQSEFSRLKLDFKDSGILRSNSLWANVEDTPNEENLSPYVSILPTSIPSGTWADITRTWADPETMWGSPYGVISANLSDERRFEGSRVLAFTREADISASVDPESGVEAGISLEQHTNLIPQGLARIRLVYYKPYDNTNILRLRLSRSSDNAVLHSETLTPEVGRWVEHTSEFVEIPETLENGGFSVGNLTGWTPGGSATWTQENSVGRTGTGSAKVVKSTASGTQTLTTAKSLFFASETISATAWLKWSDLSSTNESAAATVSLVFFDENGDEVDEVGLTDTVIGPDATGSDWVPIGGSSLSPDSGATHVAVRITVTDGTTGTFWVDDVTASIPGAARQSYSLSLTVVGDSRDSLYVSDLTTQIAPIRYFVRLGADQLHEVTDLRYDARETIVTSTQPVNEFSLRTVLISPKSWAFGCSAQPLYLR